MSRNRDADLKAELEREEAEEELKKAKLAEQTRDFLKKREEIDKMRSEKKFKEVREEILEPLLLFLKTESNFGKHHHYTSEIKLEIGLSYWGEENYEQAKLVLKDALKWLEKAKGKKYLLTLKAKYFLATCCHLLKQTKEAMNIYTELLPLQQTTLGENHAMTKATETSLANLLIFDKKTIKKGFEMLEEMLKKRIKVEGQDGEGTNEVKSLIANAYQLDHDWDACVALQKEILASREKTLGKDDKKTKETLERIDELTNPLNCFTIEIEGESKVKPKEHFILSTDNSAQEVVDYFSPILKN